MLAFATWQIYKDATRPRRVSDVVTVGDERLDRSQAELGTFERVSGSSVLRAPLRLEQEYGFGSGSKESSSVQNYFYPNGSQLTRVLTGVEEVKGTSLTAEGRILLLYTASAALRAAEIDGATHAVIRDGAVRARAPDGKGEDKNRRSPRGVE